MEPSTNPSGFKEKLKSFLRNPLHVFNTKSVAYSIIGILAFFFFLHFFAIFYFHLSSQFSDIKKPKFGLYGAMISGICNFLGSNCISDIKNSPRWSNPKSQNILRATFYLLSSIACFLLLRHEDFWPTFLGGGSSVEGIFEGFPNVPGKNSSHPLCLFHFWWLLYISIFDANWMTGLIAFLYFVLFMTNNVRVLLVFSFLFSVSHAWNNIDSRFCGAEAKSSKLLQVLSGFLKIGIHVILKITFYGVILWNFWVALGDFGSWVLWLEMVSLRVALTFLWADHGSQMWQMVDDLKLRLKKRENENEDGDAVA